MRQVVVGVLFALLLSSCGDTPQTRYIPIDYSVESPEDLVVFKHDADCLDSAANGYSFLIANSSTGVDVKKYKNNINDHLNRIYLGGSFQSKLSNDDFKTKVLVPSREVQLGKCGRYNRDSAYQVALNSAVVISKSNVFLELVLGANVLGKVDIFVHPIHEADSKNFEGEIKTGFKSDNAAYGDSKIIFFPQSTARVDSAKFWEVPFVIAHEYGHHVFRRFFESGAEIRSHHSHFQYELTTAKRTDMLAHYISSLNEGFADLFSYYSIEKDELGLESLGCMGIDRSIKNHKFASGFTKRLNNYYARIFNKTQGYSFFTMTDKCGFLDVNKEHTLGAVIAYTFDRLMSLKGYSKYQKTKILIKWLQEMQSTFFIDQFDENYLKTSVTYFFEEIKKYSDKSDFTTLECRFIKDRMPIVLKESGCGKE